MSGGGYSSSSSSDFSSWGVVQCDGIDHTQWSGRKLTAAIADDDDEERQHLKGKRNSLVFHPMTTTMTIMSQPQLIAD